MTQIHQFFRNKVAEMRRAAPDCDVWLFPEAEGYTSCNGQTLAIIPLTEVNKHIQKCNDLGRNVALLDRVSLGQHGGWKTILIAKIPATKKIEQVAKIPATKKIEQVADDFA